jgi:hypothetical protein
MISRTQLWAIDHQHTRLRRLRNSTREVGLARPWGSVQEDSAGWFEACWSKLHWLDRDHRMTLSKKIGEGAREAEEAEDMEEAEERTTWE